MSDFTKSLPGAWQSIGEAPTMSAAPRLLLSSAITIAPPGFELLDVIGQGGMGIVYRAKDVTLNREVAVKVLLERYAPNSVTAARFVEEAQITSQLQHPGIPAVYHVGQQSDGRPFLAMKLIKGRTLDEMAARNEPFNVLSVFEAIAQAVGFAHVHGVIHRDLKPHNIMIGAFGETQVMDWGLAKLLGTPEPTSDGKSSTEIRTLRNTEGDHTQAGAIMGTPAYMPPEQAAGASESVNERSDVFGLGAILCHMLTKMPPFAGSDSEATRRNAVRGKMDEAMANLETCGADRELILLCKRCLSFEPNERPANGVEVATEVARLRQAADERAHQAIVEKTRALDKLKRRRVFALAGIAVIVALAAGMVGTLMGLQKAQLARDEQAKKATEAEEARQREKDRADGEAAALRNAEQARDLARRRFDLAIAGIRKLVIEDCAELDRIPGTQKLRRNLLTSASTSLSELLKTQDAREASDNSLVQTLFLLGDLQSEFDSDSAFKNYQNANRIARLRASRHPADDEPQIDLANSALRLGNICRQMGQIDEAMKQFLEYLRLNEMMKRRYPDHDEYQENISRAYTALGGVMMDAADYPKAKAYYESNQDLCQTLSLLKPKHLPFKYNLALNHVNLGLALVYLGEDDRPYHHYRNGLAILSAIFRNEPDDADCRDNIIYAYNQFAQSLASRGKPDAALEYFAKALDLEERAFAEANYSRTRIENLATSHLHVGMAHSQLRHFTVAREHLLKCISMQESLAAEDPRNTLQFGQLVYSYLRMAELGRRLRDSGLIRESYSKAIAVCQKQLTAVSRKLPMLLDLHKCYYGFAVVLLEQGDFAEARDWLDKAKVLHAQIAANGMSGKDLEALQKDVNLELAILDRAPKACASDDAVFESAETDVCSGMAYVRLNALLVNKDFEGAKRFVDRFQTWVTEMADPHAGLHYDAACLAARLAAKLSGPDRAARQAEMFEMLNRARNLKYFTPKNLAALQNDYDYDAFADDPAFVAFVKSLEKREAAPRPRKLK